MCPVLLQVLHFADLAVSPVYDASHQAYVLTTTIYVSSYYYLRYYRCCTSQI
jgi:hypothetical protein